MHISDLHFSASEVAQSNYIRRGFLEDIRRLVSRGEKPNAIVFSGDIVNDPDEPDTYLYAIDRFIDPLCNITGVGSANIILCPGNHDFSRTFAKANSAAYDAIDKNRTDPNYISEYYSAGCLSDYARGVSRGFFDFCEYLGQPWDDPLYHNYVVSGRRFIALNSAFSCSLAGSKADRGKLSFPIAAWNSALSVAGSDPVYGIVTHFPVSDYNEAHHRLLDSNFISASKVVFHGHVHLPQPLASSNATTNCIYLQSGALHEKDDQFKGYCVVYDEEGHLKAHYRTFYEVRHEFDEATNVGHGGIFLPNEAAVQYWRRKKPAFSASELNHHLTNTVFPHYGDSVNMAIANQALADVYVFPTFGEVDITQSEDDGEPVERACGELDIKNNDENICCHFPEETGATSFLSYLAMELSKSPEKTAKPRIPFYIDIRDQKSYPAAVIQTLKAAMPAVDDEIFGWKARLEDQPFVILLDNFSPRDAEHAKWLSEAYKLLPKARYILCAKAPFALQAARSKAQIATPFAARTWMLRPLNRSEVRSMVSKFDLPQNLDRDLIVEEIRSRFKATGIPITGPLIAMYLSILREKRRYAPINAAAVIENFVESSLEKGSPSFVYRDDFDYNEQIGLLSYISETYIRRNVEGLSFEEMYDLIAQYYKDIGIRRNVPDIIRHFCDKAIFENVGNVMYFRYRVVQSYLVAKRMEKDRAFLTYIFSEDRFLAFVSELDMYFGIDRNDLASLAHIEARFDALTEALRLEFGAYVDTESAARILLPRTDSIEEFLRTISSRIAESQDAVERDRQVEAKSKRPEHFIQRFKREDEQELIIRWVKALACYSVCIKNSDAFDVGTKRRHLMKVLDGWGMLTSLGFKAMGLLLEKGTLRIGDLELNFGAERLSDPRVIRMVIANVPRYVSYNCNIYLSSGKLEEIIKAVKLDSFSEFLRIAVLADLRTEGFMKSIEAYEEEYRGNPTMLEVMMWKLRDSYLRFGLDRGYVDRFVRLIAEISADILDLRGQEREKSIVGTIRSVRNAKLRRTVRRMD